MSKFKPTWLYLKQHNITGLKYVGKTINDPETYSGSGLYWAQHLKVHGNNISTIWKRLFTNQKELTKFALNYSYKNNIVESNEYANLRPEDGLMGGDTGISDHGRKVLSEQSSSRRHPEEIKQKIREARAKQPPTMLGKNHSPETIEKIKAARALQKNIRGIIRV